MATLTASLVRGPKAPLRIRALAALAMLVGVLVAVVTVTWLGATSAEATNGDAARAAAAGGPKIAFTKYAWRDTHSYEIYKINPDGTRIERLTRNDTMDSFQPAWSPAGRKIAFVRSPNDDRSTSSIYKMNADGTRVEKLTSGYDVSSPAWSPDGGRIAFWSDRDGPGIYVMSPKGTNITKIGPAGYDARHPAWSPDGDRIAFSGHKEGSGERGIFVMDSEGAVVGDPLVYSSSAGSPDWSPDGTKIAYNAYSSIRVVNADGSDDHYAQGTGSELTDGPSWSPDGKTIVCTLSWYYDLNPDVHNLVKVKANGTKFGDGSQYRVVSEAYRASGPDWARS